MSIGGFVAGWAAWAVGCFVLGDADLILGITALIAAALIWMHA